MVTPGRISFEVATIASAASWAARLKHWIDNSWLAKYAALVQGL